MPYQWSPSSAAEERLHLWPHQSLPPKGMAAFVLATFTMISLPLYGLLGTKLLWALLPFLLLAVGGIWFALNKSYHDRRILETLTISSTETHLIRRNPRAADQHWECNTYWVRPTLHQTGGPVPNYVTLSGNGREVEIGAFLSEEERIALYDDLTRHLAQR